MLKLAVVQYSLNCFQLIRFKLIGKQIMFDIGNYDIKDLVSN